jgi:hypothetical protein
MKLDQLLNLVEETTSSSVATYSKPVSDEPQKRLKKTGFMRYATDNTCRGCNIIKHYGWSNANSNAKELTCNFCGETHKKGK